MSGPGVLVYRCRRCDRLERNPHVPDALAALLMAAAGERFPASWGGLSFGVTDLHYCGPGLHGVMDLVGAEEDGA